MEFALYGFIGIIAGAVVIKLYMDWQERKAKKEFNAFIKELEELQEYVDKPPVSDPPEPTTEPK